MPIRWFRIPLTGTGENTPAESDPVRPDYVSTLSGISGYYAANGHPDGAPVFIARVVGTETALTVLAGMPAVTELPDIEAALILNRLTDQRLSAPEWNARTTLNGHY